MMISATPPTQPIPSSSDNAVAFFRRVATTITLPFPFLPRLHPCETVHVHGPSGSGKSEMFMTIVADILTQSKELHVLWVAHRDAFPTWRMVEILEHVTRRKAEAGATINTLKALVAQAAQRLMVVECETISDVASAVAARPLLGSGASIGLIVVDGFPQLSKVPQDVSAAIQSRLGLPDAQTSALVAVGVVRGGTKRTSAQAGGATSSGSSCGHIIEIEHNTDGSRRVRSSGGSTTHDVFIGPAGMAVP